MTTDEILTMLTTPKPKRQPKSPEIIPENYAVTKNGKRSAWTLEELDGKPVSGKGHPGYFKHKKIDGDKFIEASNAYLNIKGVNQQMAAKMCGLSVPTFTKYMNIFLTDGRLDGEYFLDGRAVVFDTAPRNYAQTNDGILQIISR